MKVLTVVQARSGSRRLPAKVLLPLGRSCVLGEMLRRVQRAEALGTLVVATTTDAADDAIVECAQAAGVAVFRGHPTDLLDRHYQALRAFPADVVVKIPSDCPLIDPQVIDRVIRFYLAFARDFDYVSNLHPPSYPDGNDVEVMSAAALTTAAHEAQRDIDREHTTPFLWDHPERFRIGNVEWEAQCDFSLSHRWVLDYREDYRFIRAVYDELHDRSPAFGLADILELLETRPELRDINRQFLGDAWYQRQGHELKTWTV